MKQATATYVCPVCGASWSYEAVRYLACCRDCGSGLVRATPGVDGGVGGEWRPGERGASAELGRPSPAPVGLAAGAIVPLTSLHGPRGPR